VDISFLNVIQNHDFYYLCACLNKYDDLVEPAIHSRYASKTDGLEKVNVVMVINNFLKFILFDFLEGKKKWRW